ncbi:transposase [Thalassotalea fusca]
MPKPREQQISLSDTPYYHVCSRVVRQAYLCGVDKHSGQSYEHRRDWVEQRIHQLSQVYSIDICAYAVMHNHLHLVLHVDVEQANTWSNEEVVARWHMLFKGTLLTQRFAKQEPLKPYELATIASCVEEYRKRLMDISWFMRSLNEFIARKANTEDKCTGRFWEGRFKSQALLDEAALLSCMAYVDLNPVRANIAPTPEHSDYTSIQQRIKSAINGKQPKELAKFIGNDQKDKIKGIRYSLMDYLTLVDITGRIVRQDKRGVIDANALTILNRLNIAQENWLKIATEFEQIFTRAVGSSERLTKYYENVGISRRHGIANSRRWFSTG